MHDGRKCNVEMPRRCDRGGSLLAFLKEAAKMRDPWSAAPQPDEVTKAVTVLIVVHPGDAKKQSAGTNRTRRIRRGTANMQLVNVG